MKLMMKNNRLVFLLLHIKWDLLLSVTTLQFPFYKGCVNTNEYKSAWLWTYWFISFKVNGYNMGLIIQEFQFLLQLCHHTASVKINSIHRTLCELPYCPVTHCASCFRRSMMPCSRSLLGRGFLWWHRLCLQTNSSLSSTTCCLCSWTKLWVLTDWQRTSV